MKKKIYWKDVRKSITASKGRFLSIMVLLMLGSLALVGLKVTSPNMERTADRYLKDQKTLDLALMADYGLDQEDVEELKALKGLDLDVGYQADVSFKGNEQAVRIFSIGDRVSKLSLTQGKLPEKADQIVLAHQLADQYQIGQTIELADKSNAGSLLKSQRFQITGFAKSADIWSTRDLGPSTAGTGSLSSYGFVLEESFDSDIYSIARLYFHDLRGISAFSTTYQERLEKHEKEVEDLLADNGGQRLKRIQETSLKELQKGQEELDQADQELKKGQVKLQQSKQVLNEKSQQIARAETMGILSGSRLLAAKEELKAAQERIKLEEEGIQKAATQLQTKKEELEDNKQKVEGMPQPVYHVYNRKTLPGGQGYLMYSNSTSSITAVGNIFPVVLYLVAAMVTFTTMTRFVDEERTNAGIFKALGYQTRDIVRKFVLYGFLAGSLGTIVGILLGHYLLSPVISTIITKDTVVGASQTDFYWGYSLIALCFSLLSSVLPAYLVAQRELKDEAAYLLQPKPPVKGSRIWLEYFPFIWRRLRFTHKVTARNIFRYKERMLMTIFGVAGSVTLLFAGLGIQSSVSGVVDQQFGQILRYDLILVKDPSASTTEIAALEKGLTNPDIKQAQPIGLEMLTETVPYSKEKQSLTLMIAPQKSLDPFVHMTENGKKIKLGQGIVLTKKFAQLAGLKVGDSIQIKGEAVKVTGIMDHFVGHFAFMEPTAYEKLFGKKNENAYLLSMQHRSSKEVERLASQFMRTPGIRQVTQNASAISLFHSVAQSLNTTMAILVIVSILLAIVILYNLTNINILERIRELSTIKVLGFHNKEVTFYIYRETVLLSLVGIGLGLLGGFALHRFLIAMIAPDAILFQPQVSWTVYGFPIGVVCLLLLLLGFFVNHSLRKLDMLEALKSVE